MDWTSVGFSAAFASSSFDVSLPCFKRRNSDGVIIATAIGSGAGRINSGVCWMVMIDQASNAACISTDMKSPARTAALASVLDLGHE